MNSILLDKIVPKPSPKSKNSAIAKEPLKKLQDRTSKKKLTLKTVNFSTSSHAEIYAEQFTKRCLALQTQIHQILKVQKTISNFLCSQKNQVHLYYENIDSYSTLSEIYEFRRKNKMILTEKEAENILDCVFRGLRQLKELNLHVEMLDMDNIVKKDGGWIVSDMEIKENAFDEFESPQQSLYRQQNIDEYCKYRSSLYRLGIIILKILNPDNRISNQNLQQKVSNLRTKTLKQKLLILTELSPHKRTGIEYLVNAPETKMSLKQLARQKCSTRVSTLEVDDTKDEKIEDLATMLKRTTKIATRCKRQQIPDKNSALQQNGVHKFRYMPLVELQNAKNIEKKSKNYQGTAEIRKRMNLNHDKPSKTVRFYSQETKKGDTPQKPQSNKNRMINSSRNMSGKTSNDDDENQKGSYDISAENHESQMRSYISNQTWIQRLRTEGIIGTAPHLRLKNYLGTENSIGIHNDQIQKSKLCYEISQVQIGYQPKKINISNLPITDSQYYIHYASSSSESNISNQVSFGSSHSQKYPSFFDIEYENGYKYRGQIKEAFPHGNGTLFSPTNQQIYTGQWKFGVAEGWGIQFPNITSPFHVKSMKYMELPQQDEDHWINYEGEFMDGHRNGMGILKLKNGDIFKGYWKQGKAEGPGIYYATDGTITHGKWTNNTIQQPLNKKS